tara:strand:- start:976 stop:2127 length:1152 start_codon:yes stop_codon:yes gene_type:complete
MKNMYKKFKSKFMLDPKIVYLNHGSFGACPKNIFDSLIKYQKLLEFEPVKHLAHDVFEYLEKSRESLGNYINCNKDDVVFSPNPSTALNTVIRSLDLNDGDEILTTNHEYGALDKTWKYICKKTGAKYIQKTIPLPLESKQDFINNFAEGITKKTKVIFLSHITSPTALIFPVKEICKISREKNILSIIDGAHAPAQIKLDISDINPDIYVGACHKWMCSPKGVSFLYSKKEYQKKIDPLIISWGYEPEKTNNNQFIDYHQWQGTRDMSAFLTIPETINFLEKNNWREVTKECYKINLWAKKEINSLLNEEALSTDEFNGQMCSFYYKSKKDLIDFNIKFYLKYKIQLPFIEWNDKTLFRISIQAYNSKNDINFLLNALDDLK